MSTLSATLAVGALILAACAGGGGSGGDEAARVASLERVPALCSDDSEVDVDRVEASPREDVASALVDPNDDDFPPPLVDVSEIVSGGPPPDGIPPIDAPKFVRQCSVDWLTADDPVLAFELGGDARAYPLRIMTWHEIVNDTVGGVPVTVTYCPLCNSGIAYDRRVAGRTLDFGTSGMLYRSALVMYDRQTESLWSHFTAQAVAGALAGTELATIPMQTVSFADYRAAHPDGLVLGPDTGFDRDYGTNPYPGYDDPAGSPFLFDGAVDERLPDMTRVVGVNRRGAAVAVPTEHVLAQSVVEFAAGDADLVALAKSGTASALDSAEIAAGRDVGATGVFVPTVDGRRLHFEAAGAGFRDRETGSRWNILGTAVAGPLAGAQLDRVQHVDTFWFAWSAFYPSTTVVSASITSSGRG